MPSPKSQMDWESVWKSLNWDDKQRLANADQDRLRQRARQYAIPLEENQADTQDVKSFLTFNLGVERYGIDVMLVRGVRTAPRITLVPGTPNFYRGVINLRGQIITVLDLRPFFGLSSPDADDLPGEIIIVQAAKLHLALLAKQIYGVVSLPSSEIKPVEHLPYAFGVTWDRTVILNLAQLFEDGRLVVGTNT